MNIEFHPLDATRIDAIRKGGADDYGLPPDRAIATGQGEPCRMCLANVPAGHTYLIFAHRPFDGVNAYTETGPLFVCESCAAKPPSPELPTMLASDRYLVRGYGADEKIVYGTGDVVATPDIPAFAARLLERAEIAFVDIRSASNNCYQCRVKLAGT